VANDETAHVYALLCWRSWQKYVKGRRRWKWLSLKMHCQESLHIRRAVFRGWCAVVALRKRRSSLRYTTVQSQGKLRAPLSFDACYEFVQAVGSATAAIPLNHELASMIFEQNLLSNPCGGAICDDPRLWLQDGHFIDGDHSSGGVEYDWEARLGEIFTAIEQGDAMTVSKVLRAGVDVNAVYTPQVAATLESELTPHTVWQYPIRQCTRSGSYQVRGVTPLHVACSSLGSHNIPIVIMLLHCGASVTARDPGGRTPLQLATNPQIVSLLSDHTQRLHLRKLTKRELDWGRHVLTASTGNCATVSIWRYVVQASVKNGLQAIQSMSTSHVVASDDQTSNQVDPFHQKLREQRFTALLHNMDKQQAPNSASVDELMRLVRKMNPQVPAKVFSPKLQQQEDLATEIPRTGKCASEEARAKAVSLRRHEAADWFCRFHAAQGAVRASAKDPTVIESILERAGSRGGIYTLGASSHSTMLKSLSLVETSAAMRLMSPLLQKRAAEAAKRSNRDVTLIRKKDRKGTSTAAIESSSSSAAVHSATVSVQPIIAIDVVPHSLSRRTYHLSFPLRSAADYAVLDCVMSNLRKLLALPPEKSPLIERVPVNWLDRQRVRQLVLEEKHRTEEVRAKIVHTASDLKKRYAIALAQIGAVEREEASVVSAVRKVAQQSKVNGAQFGKDIQQWEAKLRKYEAEAQALCAQRKAVMDEVRILQSAQQSWGHVEGPASLLANGIEIDPSTLAQGEDSVSTGNLLDDKLRKARETLRRLELREGSAMKTVSGTRRHLENLQGQLQRINSVLTGYSTHTVIKMEGLTQERTQVVVQMQTAKGKQGILLGQLVATGRRLDEIAAVLKVLEEDVENSLMRIDASDNDIGDEGGSNKTGKPETDLKSAEHPAKQHSETAKLMIGKLLGILDREALSVVALSSQSTDPSSVEEAGNADEVKDVQHMSEDPETERESSLVPASLVRLRSQAVFHDAASVDSGDVGSNSLAQQPAGNNSVRRGEADPPPQSQLALASSPSTTSLTSTSCRSSLLPHTAGSSGLFHEPREPPMQPSDINASRLTTGSSRDQFDDPSITSRGESISTSSGLTSLPILRSSSSMSPEEGAAAYPMSPLEMYKASYRYLFARERRLLDAAMSGSESDVSTILSVSQNSQASSVLDDESISGWAMTDEELMAIAAAVKKNLVAISSSQQHLPRIRKTLQQISRAKARTGKTNRRMATRHQAAESTKTDETRFPVPPMWRYIEDNFFSGASQIEISEIARNREVKCDIAKEATVLWSQSEARAILIPSGSKRSGWKNTLGSSLSMADEAAAGLTYFRGEDQEAVRLRTRDAFMWIGSLVDDVVHMDELTCYCNSPPCAIDDAVTETEDSIVTWSTSQTSGSTSSKHDIIPVTSAGEMDINVEEGGHCARIPPSVGLPVSDAPPCTEKIECKEKIATHTSGSMCAGADSGDSINCATLEEDLREVQPHQQGVAPTTTWAGDMVSFTFSSIASASSVPFTLQTDLKEDEQDQISLAPSDITLPAISLTVGFDAQENQLASSPPPHEIKTHFKLEVAEIVSEREPSPDVLLKDIPCSSMIETELTRETVSTLECVSLSTEPRRRGIELHGTQLGQGSANCHSKSVLTLSCAAPSESWIPRECHQNNPHVNTDEVGFDETEDELPQGRTNRPVSKASPSEGKRISRKAERISMIASSVLAEENGHDKVNSSPLLSCSRVERRKTSVGLISEDLLTVTESVLGESVDRTMRASLSRARPKTTAGRLCTGMAGLQHRERRGQRLPIQNMTLSSTACMPHLAKQQSTEFLDDQSRVRAPIFSASPTMPVDRPERRPPLNLGLDGHGWHLLNMPPPKTSSSAALPERQLQRDLSEEEMRLAWAELENRQLSAGEVEAVREIALYRKNLCVAAPIQFGLTSRTAGDNRSVAEAARNGEYHSTCGGIVSAPAGVNPADDLLSYIGDEVGISPSHIRAETFHADIVNQLEIQVSDDVDVDRKIGFIAWNELVGESSNTEDEHKIFVQDRADEMLGHNRAATAPSFSTNTLDDERLLHGQLRNVIMAMKTEDTAKHSKSRPISVMTKCVLSAPKPGVGELHETLTCMEMSRCLRPFTASASLPRSRNRGGENHASRRRPSRAGKRAHPAPSISFSSDDATEPSAGIEAPVLSSSDRKATEGATLATTPCESGGNLDVAGAASLAPSPISVLSSQSIESFPRVSGEACPTADVCTRSGEVHTIIEDQDHLVAALSTAVATAAKAEPSAMGVLAMKDSERPKTSMNAGHGKESEDQKQLAHRKRSSMRLSGENMPQRESAVLSSRKRASSPESISSANMRAEVGRARESFTRKSIDSLSVKRKSSIRPRVSLSSRKQSSGTRASLTAKSSLVKPGAAKGRKTNESPQEPWLKRLTRPDDSEVLDDEGTLHKPIIPVRLGLNDLLADSHERMRAMKARRGEEHIRSFTQADLSNSMLRSIWNGVKNAKNEPSANDVPGVRRQEPIVILPKSIGEPRPATSWDRFRGGQQAMKDLSLRTTESGPRPATSGGLIAQESERILDSLDMSPHPLLAGLGAAANERTLDITLDRSLIGRKYMRLRDVKEKRRHVDLFLTRKRDGPSLLRAQT
jgi:hypothetical protein